MKGLNWTLCFWCDLLTDGSIICGGLDCHEVGNVKAFSLTLIAGVLNRICCLFHGFEAFLTSMTMTYLRASYTALLLSLSLPPLVIVFEVVAFPSHHLFHLFTDAFTSPTPWTNYIPVSYLMPFSPMLSGLMSFHSIRFFIILTSHSSGIFSPTDIS